MDLTTHSPDVYKELSTSHSLFTFSYAATGSTYNLITKRKISTLHEY